MVKRTNQTRKQSSVCGAFHMARNGAGFVIDAQTDEAIWIEQVHQGTALAGDTVVVRVISEAGTGPKSGAEGRVVRIEKRASRMIVGTVTATGRFTRVQPLSPLFRQEFLVSNPTCAVHVNDRVVLQFVRWTNPRLAPEGEIVEVIGPADDPSLDTCAMMKQYDLPCAFPPDVIEEAQRVGVIPKRVSSREKRLDLRKKLIFTCDPESARDYDDALSLELDEKGRRVLGVHIADVSHFVTPGSALDREAHKRSTSVYLVDHVVPMLPEQLSNGVCSLMPQVDRLTFSAFLTFDEKGVCVARRFAKSMIRSQARLTYEQVMAVIEGKSKKLKPRLRETIASLHQLAQQLRTCRFRAGALDMDVPEVEIKLDEKGALADLAVRVNDESHQLVEECMVAANEAVAQELWTHGTKILARLHEAPDEAKLEELRSNLRAFGLSCGNLSEPKNLARLMRQIKSSPMEGTLSVMILRSLKRALYSSEGMGHFGLAKKYYAHFTSPIRRYPDLVLHRQLSSYLEGKGGRLEKAHLKALARHCSEQEQNADEAERTLIEIKKFRYLESPLARTRVFDAVVGKCTRYGVFVDLPLLAVGGMVHISKLSSHYLDWNEATETLRGGGEVWQVGTPLKVKVEHVDFDRRQVDFVPVVTAPSQASQKQTKRKPRHGSFATH